MIAEINRRMITCKRCGKPVNERFRLEIKDHGYVYHVHPYCQMVRR